MGRHWRAHQRRHQAQVPLTPRSVVTRALPCLQPYAGYMPPESDDTSVSVSETTSRIPSIPYEEAARALVKQHEQYTVEGLIKFLAVQYPEIPERSRLPLIHGATTGAQVAAQMYHLRMAASAGTDEVSQNTASCLLYTSPSPRDGLLSRMPSSA